VTVTIVKLAAALLAYSGFALLHAIAAGQPLAAAGARRRAVRPTARLLAAGSVVGAASLLTPALGVGAAVLFVAFAFMCSASVVVLLAPARPSLTWGSAVIAPFVSAALLVVSRGLR
jgi:hypothetical protein